MTYKRGLNLRVSLCSLAKCHQREMHNTVRGGFGIVSLWRTRHSRTTIRTRRRQNFLNHKTVGNCPFWLAPPGKYLSMLYAENAHTINTLFMFHRGTVFMWLGLTGSANEKNFEAPCVISIDEVSLATFVVLYLLRANFAAVCELLYMHYIICDLTCAFEKERINGTYRNITSHGAPSKPTPSHLPPYQ